MAVEGRPKNFRFGRGSGVNKVKHSPEPKHETSNTARIFDSAIYYREFSYVEQFDSRTGDVIRVPVVNKSLEHEARFYNVKECSNLLRGSNPFRESDDVHIERSRRGIKSMDWSTDKSTDKPTA